MSRERQAGWICSCRWPERQVTRGQRDRETERERERERERREQEEEIERRGYSKDGGGPRHRDTDTHAKRGK